MTKNSRVQYGPDDRWVKADVASAFRTAGLRLLDELLGTKDQIYKDFNSFTDSKNILSYYKRAVALVTTVRDDIDHLFPESGQRGQAKTASTQPADRAVFVVHGHDDKTREQVARYLERLNLKPIILHEQPSEGRTLIEKFEHHSGVGFAIVLLTPDDQGYPSEQPTKVRYRARQNVILELGFFVGKLGRKRVCAVLRGDVERPSDYDGVTYVPFDDGGGWRLVLARELKAAGLEVDMNLAV